MTSRKLESFFKKGDVKAMASGSEAKKENKEPKHSLFYQKLTATAIMLCTFSVSMAHAEESHLEFEEHKHGTPFPKRGQNEKIEKPFDWDAYVKKNFRDIKVR